MQKKDKGTENTEQPKQKGKRDTLRIPLRLIPNEAEEIAEAMQSIFDEDKIVHRHGSTEPEKD